MRLWGAFGVFARQTRSDILQLFALVIQWEGSLFIGVKASAPEINKPKYNICLIKKLAQQDTQLVALLSSVLKCECKINKLLEKKNKPS